MLGKLPVLGVHAFEKAQRSATPLPLIVVPPPVATPATPIRLPAQVVLTSKADVELMCSGKGYEAHGSDTAQGFMVFAGSVATSDIGSSLSWSQRKLREDLVKSGVLQAEGTTLRFMQDYLFSSPSIAASLLCGRSANERIEWKDTNGRTLKALQALEAGQ